MYTSLTGLNLTKEGQSSLSQGLSTTHLSYTKCARILSLSHLQMAVLVQHAAVMPHKLTAGISSHSFELVGHGNERTLVSGSCAADT